MSNIIEKKLTFWYKNDDKSAIFLVNSKEKCSQGIHGGIYVDLGVKKNFRGNFSVTRGILPRIFETAEIRRNADFWNH